MLGIEIAEVVDDVFREREIRLLDPEHDALGLKVGAVFGVMRPVRELPGRVGPQRRVELHAQGVEIDARHANFSRGRHGGGGPRTEGAGVAGLTASGRG